jgi:hypothetical protein
MKESAEEPQMKKIKNENNGQPNLYLLGSGISFPDHLTVETIDILSKCRRVCTNLPDSLLERLPRDIRRKCVSLWPLYRDKRRRMDNYIDTTRAIIRTARRYRPTAWVAPGHPRIFDSVSTLLLDEARRMGWETCVKPGISSLDTLLADVGYDPAGGLFICEATGLVTRKIGLVPSAATVILQAGVFGSDRTHLTLRGPGPDIAPLRDHLLKFFPRSQQCAFVYSAVNSDQEASTFWTSLGELTTVPYEVIAGATLFIAPKEERSYLPYRVAEKTKKSLKRTARRARR